MDLQLLTLLKVFELHDKDCFIRVIQLVSILSWVMITHINA